MFKKTRRNKPAVGTIISIPIAGGLFAYAVNVYASCWWIFDFKTTKRTNDLGFFDSSRWLKFIGIVNGIGADTIDECVAVLGPLEAIIPPTWTRVPQWVVDSGRAPTQYRVTQFKPGNFEVPFWYVSEEEALTMQESVSLEWAEVRNLLESLSVQLTLIQVDVHQISPPSTVVPLVLPDPGCIYEIWMSGLDQMKSSDLEAIAEDIDDELSERDAGEVIGSGGMAGEDQQNIAVQSAPGKNKQALACIRRVLKRLNANPETTDIYVQGKDDVKLGIK